MSASIVDNNRRSAKGVASRGLICGAAILAAGYAGRLHYKCTAGFAPLTACGRDLIIKTGLRTVSMNRWLAAAESLLGRRASDPPPAWQVHCVCGRIATGQRSRVVQTPICPGCRASLFILPTSVYPRPKSPKRKVVAAPRPQTEFVAPLPSDSADLPGEPPHAAGAVRLKEAVESPSRQAALPPAPRTIRQMVRAAAGEVDLDRLRRKIFTPVRLVLAGVFAVIVLTAWWIVHLRGLDHAERMVVSATRAGEQALANHDLAEAARQYRMVRSSLDTLGRNDPQSRLLRQTASEFMAAADLSRVSLFDMLHEANDAASGRTSLTWSETFRLSYRNTWVVLDAPVSRSVDQSSRHRFEIDFPLSLEPEQAVVVGDLQIFEKAIATDGTAKRVIFAAQLDDCRRESDLEGPWTISLQPATGFLWSSPERLELLGVGVDDATKRILDEQAGLLGIAQ